MRSLLPLIVLSLTGCGHVQTLMAPDSAAAREYQQTRRFNACMNQTLGKFGSFASPESRLKATELCKEVMRST